MRKALAWRNARAASYIEALTRATRVEQLAQSKARRDTCTERATWETMPSGQSSSSFCCFQRFRQAAQPPRKRNVLGACLPGASKQGPQGSLPTTITRGGANFIVEIVRLTGKCPGVFIYRLISGRQKRVTRKRQTPPGSGYNERCLTRRWPRWRWPGFPFARRRQTFRPLGAEARSRKGWPKCAAKIIANGNGLRTIWLGRRRLLVIGASGCLGGK